MWSLAILLLSSTQIFTCVVSGSVDHARGLVWPTEYYLRVNKFQLNSGTFMPYEVWYSAKLNRSRVSYYDGIDTTYYYGKQNNSKQDYGYTYQIFSITDSNLDVKEHCEVVKYENKIREFLENARANKYADYSGEKMFNNKKVTVWTINYKTNNYTTYQTWYVYRSNSSYDVPVRLEIKEYNTWLKGLTEHTIYSYDNFKLPAGSDLDITKVKSCPLVNGTTEPESSVEQNDAFTKYGNRYNKLYDEDEHEMRKKIFDKNWREVVEHNKKNLSYKMGINRFSDRTPEELRYLNATLPDAGMGTLEFPYSEAELDSMAKHLPKSYDMRPYGIVSNVKNQGYCGSCWAFAAVVAVQGALAKSDGLRYPDLSEQSLIDCSWGFKNKGCSYGYLFHTFRHIQKYGIPTKREYGPYLGKNGKCAMKEMKKVYKIKGFLNVTLDSVRAMKVALVRYGPVAINICGSKKLHKYSNGIFYDRHCVPKRDGVHSLTVVGYGVRQGTLFWITKNSWGEEWGLNGYVLIAATGVNRVDLISAYCVKV